MAQENNHWQSISFLLIGIIIGYLFAGMVGFGGGNGGGDKADRGGSSNNNAVIASANAAFINYASEVGLKEKQFESCLNSGKYDEGVQADFDLAVDVFDGDLGTPSFLVDDEILKGSYPYNSYKQIIDTKLAEGVVSSTEGALSLEGEPVFGDPEAPITIVEFSDYQCPVCTRFHNGAFKDIVRDYVDTGKVKIVYRDLPLDSLHPNARLASSAAQCAFEQGNDKFEEYHNMLFQTQSTWSLLPKE